MSTYQAAKKIKACLENNVNSASDALQLFPKSSCGLVDDEVRLSPAYKAAHSDYMKAFNALRQYNTLFVKTFKKEYAAERKARFN